jgi:hypothetical protein
MYMNKRQILKAYDKGYLDDVVKQLRTYGTIQVDKQWDEPEGYHAGAHRVMQFDHHGINWEVHLHNGEVKQLGHTC